MSVPVRKSSGLKGSLNNPKHGEDLVSTLTDLHVSGQFADVKLVCMDGSLWSHRPLLAAVSPVLRQLLLDSSDDVTTLIMPHLRRGHLKLVLDYVYRGSMTLRARQMANVIGVIEVLHLKCGVSVSKRKDSECDWVEEAEFKDVSDKAFNELCHFVKSETKAETSFPANWVPSVVHSSLEMDRQKFGVPKITEDDLEEGDPVEVRPVQTGAALKPVENGPALKKAAPVRRILVGVSECVVEVEPDSDSDEACNDSADEMTFKGGSASIDVKCIMCGKIFQHQANLRVHIQSHLGSKAQLKSCEACDRNFRSTMEHELHLSSHNYARLIGKKTNGAKQNRSRSIATANILKKSIRIMASKPRRGNLYRKYVKRVLKLQKELKRKKESAEQNSLLKDLLEKPKKGTVKLKIKVDPNKFKPSTPLSAPPTTSSLLAPFVKDTPTSAPGFPCPDCEKSFATKGSYQRHSRKQHSLPQTSRKRKSSPVKKQPASKRPKLKINLSKSLKQKSGVISNSPKASPASSSMSSPAYSSPSSNSVRRSVEQDLTCPTCDKAFVARSIFERHLKTYKHGRYQILEEAQRTPSYIPEGGTNHMNIVLQPTMEVGGREVNKYECHLCNQVFLRVKDLAKHRQRMCTAWKS